MTEQSKFEAEAMPHMDAAYNLAFCLLRARADAEDAVQDGFLRAYRSHHQLRGDSIRPWLLTIIRNICYRRLQERRRAGNVVSLDEALSSRAGASSIEAHLAAPQISPEHSAIRASDQAMLAAALDRLPPAFREVIVLREIEELTYQEIAEVIGVPAGTVMSRLSRARGELRALLTQMMERNESNEL